MNIQPTALDGVLLISPDVHEDERGWFCEAYRKQRYKFASSFVQDNLSYSHRGVVRGLHLQWPRAQGKLVFVLAGEVFDVVADVRAGSPTYGAWVGSTLSAANRLQMWIPPGFAHGFAATSDEALLLYKCTAPYDPRGERTVRWDDPSLAIDWPVDDPTLSLKDANAPCLDEIDPKLLPRY